MPNVAEVVKVIGTITSALDGFVKLAETKTACEEPLLPSLVVRAVETKETVGSGSSLVMVWVKVELPPKVAPLGVPMTRVTVSLGSYVLSFRTEKLAVQLVLPTGIVMEEGAPPPVKL